MAILYAPVARGSVMLVEFTAARLTPTRANSTYGRALFSALPYGMNDEFSWVLSQQMEYYSSDPNADRINQLKGEMTQVRNVMIQNIDKVIERTAVRWRNVKLTVALIILLLIIVYVVLALLCDGITLPSCLK
ncbi:GRAVITY PERSISTENT SIGNAL 2, vesicle-associated membrane protein 713 [Hibiscus trionum]|uniref:GRAVITY PERSISTENT SIGNAL 2, vesicle-associated membrane protein 713 n=1 Tax=Hibiscus trionum TaxID=183268 RepID=A0A9W7HWK1_HIBTR|nr:GRAVITY PERSISTENT SIGNAL 2, vesicle-associated membrane protein 713 [Hibiscus trionum]